MSTEQPTLGDSIQRKTSERREEALKNWDGAAYRNKPSRAEREPTDAGCCRNCGRDLRADPHVLSDTLRVFGDSHDRTPVCDDVDCYEPRDGVGAADGFTSVARACMTWQGYGGREGGD